LPDGFIAGPKLSKFLFFAGVTKLRGMRLRMRRQRKIDVLREALLDFVLLGMIAAGLVVVMTGAWAIQHATGSSGWIDTIWSFAVGLGGIVAAIFANGDGGRRIAVFVIIAVWSLRLGLHIAGRTKGADEDPRYAKLIRDWGTSASPRLWLFLQVQALAAFILVLAVYLAAANPEPFPRVIDFLAITVAAIAIGGEATSDRQLADFRRTPEAKTGVMEIGLWRYSRHPNYFFEWLGWCAWPLLAITLPLGWNWLTLLAPMLMYWLLVHVSGIPPLEQHMLASRGDKFRALQARVNAFFPGPRKGESLI
jgi:steroid 5-alpha reductase family enzyme